MNKKVVIIIITLVLLAGLTTGLVLGLTRNKTNFAYKVKNNEIYITGLKSPEKAFGKELIIPESINGKPVVSIIPGKKGHEFKSNTYRNIIFPNSLRYIGDGVFQNITLGETLIIPDTVQEIGKYAFANSIIRKVVLGKGIIILGDGAFLGCLTLDSFMLENSLKHIGYGAFSNCISLANIELPATLETIGDYAFASTALIEIVIPDSVIQIGQKAFDSISTLVKVALGDGLNQIDSGVFNNCIQLNEVEMGENITSITKGAFYNCISLKRLELNQNVTLIEDMAFSWCGGNEGIQIISINNSINIEGYSNWNAIKKLYVSDKEEFLAYLHQNIDDIALIKIIESKVEIIDYTGNS